MADIKISELTPATTLTGTEEVPVVQTGSTVKTTTQDIADLAAAGSGTVTDVSIVPANGISGTVATSTTTPAITLALGAIAPSSVAASGTITGSNLSGTNTGDQTLNSLLPSQTGNAGKVLETDGTNSSWQTASGGGISALTGDVTASGSGSVAATVALVGGATAANVASATTKVNGSGASQTEIGYLVGVSSAIQTQIDAKGTGTVSTVSVVTANGVSGTVANPTTTPAITVVLGAITPTSIVTAGNVTSFGAVSAVTSLSTQGFIHANGNIDGLNLQGTNTGDQTISASGDVTASGTTGNLVTTVATVGGVSAASIATAVGSYVPNTRTISTTAPLTGGGDLSANRTLAMPASTNSVDGYLTSADHTTFAAKQPAGNYITALTGDVIAAGPGSVGATIPVGTVTDTKAALAVKPACTVVATSNQALTGTPTIDGVATAAGSIILLTAQTSGSENGPWVAAAGAWSRPTWYPSGGTSQSFQFITTFIRLGTTYQGATWRQTAAGPITIDTTPTTWANTPRALNSNAVTGLLPLANFTPGSNTQTLQTIGGVATWAAPASPYNVSTINSNTAGVNAVTYLCDTSGGAFSLTLPTPAANVFVVIKDKTGSFGTNNLTIVRAAAEKIEGLAASKVLLTNWGSWSFFSDGTDWFMGPF